MAGKLMAPDSTGPLQRQRDEAKSMGVKAAAWGAGSTLFALLAVAAWPWFAIPALAGYAITGVKAFDWLKYRGKWGLKF